MVAVPRENVFTKREEDEPGHQSRPAPEETDEITEKGLLREERADAVFGRLFDESGDDDRIPSVLSMEPSARVESFRIPGEDSQFSKVSGNLGRVRSEIREAAALTSQVCSGASADTSARRQEVLPSELHPFGWKQIARQGENHQSARPLTPRGVAA